MYTDTFAGTCIPMYTFRTYIYIYTGWNNLPELPGCLCCLDKYAKMFRCTEMLHRNWLEGEQ